MGHFEGQLLLHLHFNFVLSSVVSYSVPITILNGLYTTCDVRTYVLMLVYLFV